MTGMAEPPSDLQSTVAVGQQGMGTAGPTASAPGGPMVPPMPHGLTVQVSRPTLLHANPPLQSIPKPCARLYHTAGPIGAQGAHPDAPGP